MIKWFIFFEYHSLNNTSFSFSFVQFFNTSNFLSLCNRKLPTVMTCCFNLTYDTINVAHRQGNYSFCYVLSMQEYTKLGDLHPRVQEKMKKMDPAEYSNMADPHTFSRYNFYVK